MSHLAPTGSDPSTASGRVNQNFEPSPTRLSTPIWPPINSTSRLQIASPRPVPPKRLVVEASACEKRSNRRLTDSAEMPMPLSSIEKRSTAAGVCRSAGGASSTLTRTWP
jgi:hypothetical protein